MVWEIPMKNLIDAWHVTVDYIFDQSQSMNLWMEEPDDQKIVNKYAFL